MLRNKDSYQVLEPLYSPDDGIILNKNEQESIIHVQQISNSKKKNWAICRTDGGLMIKLKIVTTTECYLVQWNLRTNERGWKAKEERNFISHMKPPVETWSISKGKSFLFRLFPFLLFFLIPIS